MDISKSELFYNISPNEQKSMMECFKSYVKTYESGEIISYFDTDNKSIGILEEGSAQIARSFENGAQAILEYLMPDGIFGSLFYFYTNRESIFVEATSKCKVRFIDYEHIIKRCPKACPHHSQLVQNVLCMISDKAAEICEHLDVLSQRTIRDRLKSYFGILSAKEGSKSFDIPFSMGMLSDYLSVDRSAMSRELGKMKEDGLIELDRHHVTLLYD